MVEQKLLGDYLEGLINGWCPHSTMHTAVQALKCPRCIGDALNDVQKQARAEVLAACLVFVPYHDSICCVQRKLARFEKESHAGRVVHGVCKNWCDACPRCCIENLQPAASALEELLREAESKGIKWAQGRGFAQTTARIATLEKARAEGKG